MLPVQVENFWDFCIDTCSVGTFLSFITEPQLKLSQKNSQHFKKTCAHTVKNCFYQKQLVVSDKNNFDFDSPLF
ncbi:hypothetical protein B566_EDAN002221 [Ephemera danica]|nr:hypothetical protein B566_EDAN002221 [Ephemera danica]